MQKRKLYDPDGKNDDRALWAETALKEFQSMTGTDDCDAICDLLCNLMHLADRRKLDYGTFDAALGRARHHYECEISKDGGF